MKVELAAPCCSGQPTLVWTEGVFPDAPVCFQVSYASEALGRSHNPLIYVTFAFPLLLLAKIMDVVSQQMSVSPALKMTDVPQVVTIYF